MILSADWHDDVLPPFGQVRHRRAGRTRRQLGFPEYFSRGLVIRAELVPERIPGNARNSVAAFADEEQCLGDERRGTAGGPERRKVQVLQRRMIPRTVAVGNLPR